MFTSGDEAQRPDGAEGAEHDRGATEEATRRWRLVARLDEVLDVDPGSRDRLQRMAEIIAEELGDAVLLAAASRANLGATATAFAHLDPARNAVIRQAVVGADDADIIAAADWVTQQGSVVIDPHAENFPAWLAQAYRRYDADVGVGYLALVSIRFQGETIGLLASARDIGSAPYSAQDHAALQAAAAKAGLLLGIVHLGLLHRESFRRWDLAFAGSPVGMFALDADGIVISANLAAASILGRPAELIVGVPGRRLLSQSLDLEDGSGVGGDLVGGVRTFRVVRPDDEVRWIRVAMTPISDPADPATWSLVQFSDVSDWYRAEERAAVFESLVRSSPDFIAIADLEGRLTFVNDAGRRMVAIPDDVDITTLRSTRLWPSDTDIVAESGQGSNLGSWQGIAGLRPWDSGPEIPVLATTFVVPDLITGRPMAIATKRRDVRAQLADQRELEALSEQRRALLRELVDAEHDERRRLAEDLHDEPVQLLAAAQLRLQVAEFQQATGDGTGTAESVHHAAELVDSAVGSLRRIMSEIETTVDPTTDMAAHLRQTVAMLFAGSGTTVLVDGQVAGLTEVAAAALQRSAREALSNARRHSHAHTVQVRLEDGEWDSSVVVEDDGVGIGDVEPERQGHLGVRIMTNRIEALGGHVTFARRLGGGTVVTLSVPRPLDRSAAAQPDAARR